MNEPQDQAEGQWVIHCRAGKKALHHARWARLDSWRVAYCMEGLPHTESMYRIKKPVAKVKVGVAAAKPAA